MSFSGALRSIQAAQRREERSIRRQYREAQRQAKEDLKEQQLEHAQHMTECYELQLKSLGSVHHDSGPLINWQHWASAPLPPAPAPASARTQAATKALETYVPGFFAKLFGGEAKARARLAAALEVARRDDAAETEQARAAHVQTCADLEEARQLAHALLRGDMSRYQDALDSARAFDELREVASGVSSAAVRPDLVWVEIVLPTPDKVVPEEQFSVSKGGKLATKAMPKGRANEIYQDYVCGAALRAVREVFATLPIPWCAVNVRSRMLNPATGHIELGTLLSVIAPRRTSESLRYDALDPSDAMKNFLHRMGFKKSAGMAPVEPLTVADLPR